VNAAGAPLWLTACLMLAGPAAVQAAGPVAPVGFDPVYDLLTEYCGGCHVQGQADGPWSLDTPPTAEHFPVCLGEPVSDRLRCATYHQLVDAPAPGIPAWIRPEDGPASEPYAQACDPEVSFHIGHSLPAPLDAGDCALFLDWIESGAQR